MKKLLLITALVSLSATARPVDGDHVKNKDLAEKAADYVESLGYRCDSLSAFYKSAWSGAFTLSCNNYKYTYTIEDKGGRWVVTVD